MRVIETDSQGRPVHFVFKVGDDLPFPMPHEIKLVPATVPVFPKAEPIAAPGLFQRAVNFAKATARHVAAGMPKATADQQALRLALCRSCPLLVHEAILGEVCSHPSCGCAIVEKTSWADQGCPLDPPRWRPYEERPRPVSERLEDLVAECDYRGGIVTTGGCGCTARWHCGMGKGEAPHPLEVTKARCLQCVLGNDQVVTGAPPGSGSSGS